MNLLPGLRELRAPLASGYLWLISAWVFLGHMHWLPVKRPPGNSEVARLWDLGGTLGKTIVLAALTFIAYLIGSFLEMDPDGRTARTLARFVLRDRQPSYMDANKGLNWSALPSSFRAASVEVARSLSEDARSGLIDYLSREGTMGADIYPDEEAPGFLEVAEEIGMSGKEKEEAFKQRKLRIEIASDQVISLIIREMPQLASRLLVKNKELYGKYDRHVAEAAVRMNVSIPLTLLLVLAIVLSGLQIVLRVALPIIVLAFGIMLLRQGVLRMVSARDVIAQALAIEEVQSRHIRVDSAVEHPSGGKGTEVPMEELERIQRGGSPDAERENGGSATGHP